MPESCGMSQDLPKISAQIRCFRTSRPVLSCKFKYGKAVKFLEFLSQEKGICRIK